MNFFIKAIPDFKSVGLGWRYISRLKYPPVRHCDTICSCHCVSEASCHEILLGTTAGA